MQGHETAVTQAQQARVLPPIQYDWKALEKGWRKAFDVIKGACKELWEKRLIPFYNQALFIASAENPKWWYYYKHAKRRRTREKYRRLLQNKFLLLLLQNGNSK